MPGVNYHSIVIAQIYILRSLTGIAGGDAPCQEEGPGSARTAVQQTRQAKEKE